MKIQIDVDAVLPAELDGPVDGLDRVIVDLHPVLRAGPGPIGARQTSEVEAPLLHPLKIQFTKLLPAPAAGKLGEVEAAPARDARLGPRRGRRLSLERR